MTSGPVRSSALTPLLNWDDRLRGGRGGYRAVATGRVVPDKAVRDALDVTIDASKQRISQLTESLRAGQINITEWRAGMADTMKTMHTASAASAKGGWAQMSQADWGATGPRLKEQYKFLDNFAQEIVSGKQKMDGTLTVRAGMYGDAARDTHELMRKRIAIKAGSPGRSNVLGEADHCPDCLDQTALGMLPIDDPRWIEIGDRQCRTNCKCTWDYANPDEALA